MRRRIVMSRSVCRVQALIGLALVLSMPVGAAGADAAREKIAAGKAHFDQGRYEAALQAFDELGEMEDATLNAELLHNRAATQFKLGRLDEARELWVRASSLRDVTFEGACSYNLGNCDYETALDAISAQDAQAALAALEKSRQYYRDALRLDPLLTNARANLELANQLIKQIKEQSSTQPQSQSQPSPEQQQGDQSQEQQNSSQPASQPSEDQNQEGQSGENQDDGQGDPQKEQPQDSKSDQSEGEGEPQEQPSEREESTQSQPSPQSQPGQQQEAQEAQGQEGKPPIEMTKEQAERLMQMVRDAERERRALLRARERGRYKPVDKDW